MQPLVVELSVKTFLVFPLNLIYKWILQNFAVDRVSAKMKSVIVLAAILLSVVLSAPVQEQEQEQVRPDWIFC